MVIAGVVVVVLIAALLYRGYLQHRVAEARLIRSRNGIDSLERVRIGGIDQWIEVRGQNVDNPILLFLHGGPGIAFIPLANSFQGPWEESFTVVEWDQRGAGKTYSSNNKELQQRTMNVPQFDKSGHFPFFEERRRFTDEMVQRVLPLAHATSDNIYSVN